MILVCAAAPACSSSPSGQPAPAELCPVGRLETCAGPNQCTGQRRCEGSPAKWTKCVCQLGPGADAVAPEELGGACSSDADCPRGAFCLSGEHHLYGGRSAVGVCVADCTNDADACRDFASAICVAVPEESSLPDGGVAQADAGPNRPASLCFERCTVSTKASDKCHALTNVACDRVDPSTATGTAGFCRPLCVNDDDCGSGKCDRRFGVCRDAPSGRTASVGTPCDGTAASNPCEGLCVSLSAAYAVCSHRCVFGDTTECADPGSATRIGGCVFASPGGTIGDVGYCSPLCDCGGDCSSGSVCDGFGNATLEGAFERAGVCTSPDLVAGSVLVCAP